MDTGSASETEEEEPAEEEAEISTDQKPSLSGEGGSAEALTDEVVPPAETTTETEQPAEEEESAEKAPAEEGQVAEAEPVEALPVVEEPAEEAPAVALPVANELTYNGEAQALVEGESGWLYSLDGETYSAEIPTAVNAGEYTVYFKAAGADEPQSITITVAKADAVFTPPVAAVSVNEGE